MVRPRRAAATALIGSGATITGFYGFLIGEAVLARRAIGTTDARPPSPDGVYGDDLPGRPIRLLVLGDSAAVGYGMTSADATPSAMLGLGLAHVMDAPVEVRCHAVVGAQTSDLMDQLDLVTDWEPHVAVIVIGTNDVTHQVPPSTSARLLGDVVRRLVAADCEVVVGTAPDLGSVRPIMQPLRAVARRWSRNLARKQTIAVVGAGGRAVSLGDLLGNLFIENRDIMFGLDRFHPSETGYANMVAVLVPAVTASLREKALTTAYADFQTSEPPRPRDLMSVRDAAAEAAENAGTQVVQDEHHGGGRWATVLRRRRAG
jgi:lysophospholipase L1-like esterase